MISEEIEYLSSDGASAVSAMVWKPGGDKSVKGIVQIAHGMCEHIGRYSEFAGFLTENGYICCANDHIGHGGSYNGHYGYMGEKDGYLYMLEDLRKLYLIMKPQYKQIPYFLLGHSMGSFLARLYCAKYGGELSGVLYSGTGDSAKNKYAFHFVILLCRLLIKVKGAKSPGIFFAKTISKTQLKKFKNVQSPSVWLTRDEALVRQFSADEKSGFKFTYAAYLDLFLLIKSVSIDKWVKHVPPSLPSYIFSGTNDAIGEYGKDPAYLYERLLAEGAADVTLKLYEGGRHEMLNEINRKEVYADILKWLDARVDNFFAKETDKIK